MPNNSYGTDPSGHVYMNINIIGHVATPGSYKIYEGADILTILSTAGGYLPGSKLDRIFIYRKGEKYMEFNLIEYMNNGKNLDIDFIPNDTILIKESSGSIFFSKIGFLNTIISLINLYVVIIK
jgi:protein involved in polysaccharide export with SLBB domain